MNAFFTALARLAANMLRIGLFKNGILVHFALDVAHGRQELQQWVADAEQRYGLRAIEAQSAPDDVPD